MLNAIIALAASPKGFTASSLVHKVKELLGPAMLPMTRKSCVENSGSPSANLAPVKSPKTAYEASQRFSSYARKPFGRSWQGRDTTCPHVLPDRSTPLDDLYHTLRADLQNLFGLLGLNVQTV
ncbi:MAG: hypothetical protein ACOYYS_08640 [Chloroflexota bacterium]